MACAPDCATYSVATLLLNMEGLASWHMCYPSIFFVVWFCVFLMQFFRDATFLVWRHLHNLRCRSHSCSQLAAHEELHFSQSSLCALQLRHAAFFVFYLQISTLLSGDVVNFILHSHAGRIWWPEQYDFQWTVHCLSFHMLRFAFSRRRLAAANAWVGLPVFSGSDILAE